MRISNIIFQEDLGRARPDVEGEDRFARTEIKEMWYELVLVRMSS